MVPRNARGPPPWRVEQRQPWKPPQRSQRPRSWPAQATRLQAPHTPQQKRVTAAQLLAEAKTTEAKQAWRQAEAARRAATQETAALRRRPVPPQAKAHQTPRTGDEDEDGTEPNGDDLTVPPGPSAEAAVRCGGKSKQRYKQRSNNKKSGKDNVNNQGNRSGKGNKNGKGKRAQCGKGKQRATRCSRKRGRADRPSRFR